MASYRFLKDHSIGGQYYQAGTIADLPDWIPTADVDPLDADAVAAFNGNGPVLPGLINSQWTGRVIAAPVTYWYQTAPNVWVMSGLGSAYPSKTAYIGRVE